MARPVIGVTESREEPAALYAEAVEDAGGSPVVIDLAAGGPAEDVLAEVSGLLLTGGGDVDPTLYGQERHPETRVKRGRDETEFGLIRAAIERDMPVFGICRGMQAINVALGGSLDQHVLDHRSPERAGAGAGLPRGVRSAGEPHHQYRWRRRVYEGQQPAPPGRHPQGKGTGAFSIGLFSR